jgi:hypothetical protein
MGDIIDITIEVTAYHGGLFQFKIQDVDGDDPDGNLWKDVPALIIISYLPRCDNCPLKEPCIP